PLRPPRVSGCIRRHPRSTTARSSARAPSIVATAVGASASPLWPIGHNGTALVRRRGRRVGLVVLLLLLLLLFLVGLLRLGVLFVGGLLLVFLRCRRRRARLLVLGPVTCRLLRHPRRLRVDLLRCLFLLQLRPRDGRRRGGWGDRPGSHLRR